MCSKSNFSSPQVKEILDNHETTLMKFLNTAIEKLEKKTERETTENAIPKKDMTDLKSSI